jgi:hypothetical protein
MNTYIGLWDCTSCGNKGILGPHTSCSGCGASRPKNVFFYLHENAEATDDSTHTSQAQAGVDWVCGHCKSHNKAWEFGCQSCGNEKDEISGDIHMEESDYVEAQTPPAYTPPPPRKKKWFSTQFWVLSFIGLVAYAFYHGRTKELLVKELTWELQAPLEHLEIKHAEGWDLPNEAFNVQTSQVSDGVIRTAVGSVSRTREVKVQTGTEKYVCGKINKGNGYFVNKYCDRPKYGYKTEYYQEPRYIDVPKFRKKYAYNIKDWVTKDTVKHSGMKGMTISAIENPKKGDSEWRIGPERKVFVVVYNDSREKIYKREIPESAWDKMKIGEKIKAKVALLSGKLRE